VIPQNSQRILGIGIKEIDSWQFGNDLPVGRGNFVKFTFPKQPHLLPETLKQFYESDEI